MSVEAAAARAALSKAMCGVGRRNATCDAMPMGEFREWLDATRRVARTAIAG